MLTMGYDILKPGKDKNIKSYYAEGWQRLPG